jgi:alpha-glucosidase
LKRIETTWDETRYLDGYPGEDILMARRKGSAWYVGGMTNEESREARFIADFPGAGTWKADLWKDGPETEADPSQLVKETVEIKAGETVIIKMERGGGFVMIMEPAEALN